MLTEAELRALITLHGELTVSELAARLDRSLSYTSELVERLESTGLIETTREGKTKQLRLSDAKGLELLDRFSQQYPHITFPALLAGATLRVLYFLDRPRSATALAANAGVHRSTVHRTLSPLQNRGLVYRTDDNFALNEEFEQLSDLARELAHHHHRQQVEHHTDTYTILWESLDEFLVQTAYEITAENFVPTGPDRFQEYDLPLLARDHRYYLYSDIEITLSPAVLCCHMLVIDSGTRSHSYCLLLLTHSEMDSEELRTQAEKYGVEALVEDLLAYLDTNGDHRTSTLPRWDEFRDLAAEYGVAV
jgi:DNA-binding MarR family transcriptional regulator